MKPRSAFIICLFILTVIIVYNNTINSIERFNNEKNKIAFIFLTVGDINKHAIWDKFFRSRDELYTIYVHPKFPEQVTSFFKEYIIHDLVWTKWGDVSLVEATNNLISNALKDKKNTKLILVSDSCIPIKSFDEIYSTVMKDNLSWFNYYKPLDSVYDHRIHFRRINSLPDAIRNKSYIQEQWMILDRTHAITINKNKDFLQYFRKERLIPDEMYYLTLLNILYTNIKNELRLPEHTRDEYLKHQYITCANWFDIEQYNESHPKKYKQLVRKDLIYLLNSKALFARKFDIESDIDFYWDYIIHKT